MRSGAKKETSISLRITAKVGQPLTDSRVCSIGMTESCVLLNLNLWMGKGEGEAGKFGGHAVYQRMDKANVKKHASLERDEATS